jgi:thiol-disulfide isomerase/thioredoxin
MAFHFTTHMTNKTQQNSLMNFFAKLKPWLLAIVIVLILRYTGMLAGVSAVTQQALLKTGVMDASPEENMPERNFDYGFSVRDINKNTVSVESLKGKVIFINVWATWCGPCRAEMPSIQGLYNSIDHEKVAFVMLAVDQKDPYQKVTSFIKDKEYTFPVYFPDGSLPSLLRVPSIPSTFVISKEGKVVFREAGAANYDTDEFRSFLQKLY